MISFAIWVLPRVVDDFYRSVRGYSQNQQVGELLLDKSSLNDIVARLADPGRHLESALIEHARDIGQHGGATANHCPIGFGVERRQTNVFKQLTRFHQLSDPAFVA